MLPYLTPVTALSYVHHHRPVRLRRIFLTESRNLGDPNLVLFAEYLRRFGSNSAVLSQNCRTIGTVYLNWVQLVSHDPETRCSRLLRRFLDQLLFASSLQVTRMRVVSIASLITPGCALFLSSSSTLDVSVVHYNVSAVLLRSGSVLV